VQSVPTPNRRKLAYACALAVALIWAFAFVFLALSWNGPSSGDGPADITLLNVLLALAFLCFPAVGFVLALRRPENPIGWLLLGVGVAWGLTGLSAYAEYGLIVAPGSVPGAAAAAAIAWPMWAPAVGITFTFVLLLFPDGHLPGRRWRWVAYAAAFAITAITLVGVLTPGKMTNQGFPDVTNPLGVDAVGTLSDNDAVFIPILLLAMVGSAASVVVRYRRSHGVERQQIKWLTTAAAVIVSGIALTIVPSLVFASDGPEPWWQAVMDNVVAFSYALIPLSIGVAVVRYRLYEIDVIIRKTLVYAILAVALALVYLGGISSASVILRAVTGQSGAVAVTLSTLAVAVTFQPLRTWIQRAVDRRFYRRKYDSAQTLREFNSRLRQEIDLDALSAEMLNVVTETVQPSHASMWLRSGPPP
jgi:hypothetical protein